MATPSFTTGPEWAQPSATERKAIEELRAYAAEKGEIDEQSDGTMLRFLRARGLKVPVSYDMMKKAVEWFAEDKPGEIPESAAETCLGIGKAFWLPHVRDRFGRPILVAFGRMHDKGLGVEQNVIDTKYLLEQGVRMVNDDGGGLVVIVDLKGLSWSNIDYKFTQALVTVLQEYYAERLGTLLLINTPMFFYVAWKIIKPWLDERTARKVKILGGKYEKEVQELIAPESLPKFLGGELDYEYKFQPNFYTELDESDLPPLPWPPGGTTREE